MHTPDNDFIASLGATPVSAEELKKSGAQPVGVEKDGPRESPTDHYPDPVIADDGFIVLDRYDNLVGLIAYPASFCPIGEGGVCDADPDMRHLMAFHLRDGWWVHTACGQPTRPWWEAYVATLITFETNYEPPWSK